VPGLGFVFLELTRETAAQRVANRPGHFMPASLIDSQFAALEAPHGEPLTLPLDATQPIAVLAETVDAWLKPCGERNLARTA
jgi:gluconokinase